MRRHIPGTIPGLVNRIHYQGLSVRYEGSVQGTFAVTGSETAQPLSAYFPPAAPTIVTILE